MNFWQWQWQWQWYIKHPFYLKRTIMRQKFDDIYWSASEWDRKTTQHKRMSETNVDRSKCRKLQQSIVLTISMVLNIFIDWLFGCVVVCVFCLVQGDAHAHSMQCIVLFLNIDAFLQLSQWKFRKRDLSFSRFLSLFIVIVVVVVVFSFCLLACIHAIFNVEYTNTNCVSQSINMPEECINVCKWEMNIEHERICVYAYVLVRALNRGCSIIMVEFFFSFRSVFSVLLCKCVLFDRKGKLTWE